MSRIATLTLNPAIDIACEAEEVRHTRKIRTFGDRMEPGGGGINVARALCGFGVPVQAIYLAGGPSGAVLDGLVAERGIDRTAIPIAGTTRISLAVYERASGLEYRFVPEGPEVRESEWAAALEAAGECGCDMFIASGSLPRGVPDDFYARLGESLTRRGIRYLLDTSGAELRAALAQGGVFLVKPSRGELEQLVGAKLADMRALGEAAAAIVAKGQAEHVAVTLGRDGALLASGNSVLALPALKVEECSAVGAGDSFVAAMAHAFASGMNTAEAFRRGVAAGAAAVQAPGTDLCNAEEVERLLLNVPQPERIA